MLEPPPFAGYHIRVARAPGCYEGGRVGPLLTRLAICRVLPTERERFEEGQLRWGVLAGQPGFRGLAGGWRSDVPNQAVLISYWTDSQTLTHFMDTFYAPLVHEHGLYGTTIKMAFTDWSLETWVPGECDTIHRAFPKANLLRIVRCGIKQSQIPNFLESQRAIWNPGLLKAPGHLMGAISSGLPQRSDFLATMFWRSAADHQHYLDTAFGDLYTRSGLGGDTTWLEGMRVGMEPRWTVTPLDEG